MSTIASTCSMSTGHSSTHAPHVVQDQRTSGSMTSGTSAWGSCSWSCEPAPTFCAPMSRSDSANIWSRMLVMTSFGLVGERGVVELGAAVEQQRHDDEEDHPEDDPRLVDVRAVEPGPALESPR